MADKESSSKKRDPLFDVVKFVAIFLVVAGHVFGKGCVDSLPTWFWNFRDEMTMPLFFILSGYFAAPTIEKGDWRKLMSHIRSYLQPFFVLSLIFTPLYILCNGFSEGWIDFLMYPTKRILFAGWFVWVLSFSYMIAFVSYRPLVGVAPLIKIVATLLVIVGLYFLPELPMGACQLSYLPLVFPFFVFGFLWRKVSCFYENRDRGKFVWKMLGLCCFVIYLGVVFVGPSTELGLSMYSGQIYGITWITSPAALVKTGLRIAVGLIGSFGIITVFECLISCSPVRCLASLGTTSLGVYLLHQWLLDRIIESGILPSGISLCIVIAISLFLLCHFIVNYSKRYRFLNIYLWGSLKV